MSKELSIYYNKKRLIIILIISLLSLYLFFWIFSNATTLTAKIPDGASRYRWVGIVFYQNPLFLKIVSSIFILLFSYGFIISIKKLISKKMKLKNIQGVLYIDNKAIVKVSQIKKVKALVNGKDQKYIRIYLVNPDKYINSKNNPIQRFILKSNYKRFGTPLVINCIFYGENLDDIKKKILKTRTMTNT